MSSAKRLRAEGHPIGEVYLGRDEIAARVDELGREVSGGYAGRLPLLVAPLKSSAVFLADLSRALAVDHELDVIELAPYGSGRSGGGVRLLKDLDRPLAGRDVLIVEDIIDTGLTLNYLVRYLRGKNPASLRICTLLDKPARRLVEIPVDYTGFTIPDQFVVGYGLDYGELYRNLRFVAVLRPEVYAIPE